MAEQLRRCDVTLHPGLGEGFGYPIFESLACGVPAIHGDYAGGASIMHTCKLDDLLIQPKAWRLEGQFNCIRPVFDVEDWVRCTMNILREDVDRQALAASVGHLDWRKLSHVWKRWLREGLGDEQ
jgi:glycosyltransferase involved in cell wall biosynthesis